VFEKVRKNRMIRGVGKVIKLNINVILKTSHEK